MDAQRLFLVQFVVAVEEQWFAPGTGGPPIRAERQHFIESLIFAAADPEAAYRTACDWLPGYSDSNHDGPGDLTRPFAIGIHDIEELTPVLDDLQSAVRRPYGVDVGRYDPGAVDPQGVPLVRGEAELEISRYPRR